MTDIYRQALEIYEEVKDQDFADYTETQEEDITYIVNSILKIGYNQTLIRLMSL